MKRRFVNKITVLLVFTLLLSAFTSIVFAEEAPGVELPVTVSLSGTPPPSDSKYVIILEAESPEYPMPEGSVDGKYELSMTGASTTKFPEIEFTSPGVYTYKIYQSKDINDYYSYDDRVYNLIIDVTSKGPGVGLETSVILYLTGETEKQEVFFELEVEVSQVLPGYEPDEEEEPDKEEDDEDWGVLPGYDPDSDGTGVETGIQTNVQHYLTILGVGIISFIILLRSKKDRLNN